jgi:hypothetical protein
MQRLVDGNELLGVAAFQLLLSQAEPVSPDALADAIGTSVERVMRSLEELDGSGRIRRDGVGRVVGSAGLSVVPDRHQIDLNSRRFWTWCAYDILGIFGALKASGHALSSSLPDGEEIELQFIEGRPQPKDVVLFRPDMELMAGCSNVYEDWCPNSNLFANRQLAETWARQRGLVGRVLSIDEASVLAADDWRPLAEGLST